jgi:hypothetical protein
MKQHQCYSLVLVLVTGVWLSSASTVRAAEPLRPALRSDARLIAPITLYREAILLGDLLRLIGQKTKTTLRTNPQDPGMGTLELALGADRVPAWKLLEALPSLHLGCGAGWGWRGDGSPQRPYTLYCSRPLAELPAAARERVDQAFREQIGLSILAASLPQEERAAFLQEHPEFERTFSHPTAALGIRAFAALSPEVRQHIVAGGNTTLPVAGLPPEAQEYVRARGSSTDRITLEHWHHAADVAPRITIHVGNAGGHTVFGGLKLEARLREIDERLWHADADSREVPNTLPQRSVDLERQPAGAPAPAEPRRPFPGSSERRKNDPALSQGGFIKWLTLTYGTPIVSDLSWRRSEKHTVAQHSPQTSLLSYMKVLPFLLPVMYKVKNGVLLIRDRAWLNNRAYGRVPYPLVLDLRRRLSARAPVAAEVWEALAPLGALDERQLSMLAPYFSRSGVCLASARHSLPISTNPARVDERSSRPRGATSPILA